MTSAQLVVMQALQRATRRRFAKARKAGEPVTGYLPNGQKYEFHPDGRAFPRCCFPADYQPTAR